jgi:hypothetical protein
MIQLEGKCKKKNMTAPSLFIWTVKELGSPHSFSRADNKNRYS